jgi:5'-nucleotidase
MMRGLTIDKARGNVLKVDRHKYVKLAYHGFRQMTTCEKQAMYAQGTQRHSFDTDDFSTIDTLFSLAEAYLFMQVPALCTC